MLERNDIVGFERPRKLSGYDGIIAAVRAPGRSGSLITDELCPAGGAVVGPHLCGIASPACTPGTGPGCFFFFLCGSFCLRSGGRLRSFFCLRSLFCLCSLFFRFLFCGLRSFCRRSILRRKQLFNFLNRVGASAVIALQFSCFPVKMKGTGTRRTLIIGDLICHLFLPLLSVYVQDYLSIFRAETSSLFVRIYRDRSHGFCATDE